VSPSLSPTHIPSPSATATLPREQICQPNLSPQREASSFVPTSFLNTVFLPNPVCVYLRYVDQNPDQKSPSTTRSWPSQQFCPLVLFVVYCPASLHGQRV